MVVSSRHRFADGALLAGTLAGNYNKRQFDRITGTPTALSALGVTTPLFDLTQQLRFSDSLPRTKITLDLNYTRGPLTLSMTNTRYGRASTVALMNRTPAQIAALIRGYNVTLVPVSATSANSDIIQHFGTAILTDIEPSWQLTHKLRLSAGAQNILDVYPDRNIASNSAGASAGTNEADNAGTVPYNAISPFGFNGRTLFIRATAKL